MEMKVLVELDTFRIYNCKFFLEIDEISDIREILDIKKFAEDKLNELVKGSSFGEYFNI